MNSDRVIDSIFDDIIDDFVEEQAQKAEIKRNKSIISDLLVECVVCQIFDDIYYHCIDKAVKCTNMAAQREAEGEKRMELMAGITVEGVFDKLIDDELDDAQAKQRVKKEIVR